MYGRVNRAVAARAVLAGTLALLAACASHPKLPSSEPVNLRAYHHLEPDRLIHLADLRRLYPTIPLRLGVRGKVVLHCTLEADGRLHDCRIVSEDPPRQGFGIASLKAAQTFQVRPLLRNGRPLKRELIELPFDWTPGP